MKDANKMKGCDTILEIYPSLTAEQQEDLNLFQRSFKNKEPDQYQGNEVTPAPGGMMKEGRWLVLDENMILGIGQWEGGFPCYGQYPPDLRQSIHGAIWAKLSGFHGRIECIIKPADNAFELKLKSGLSIYVAPRIGDPMDEKG